MKHGVEAAGSSVAGLPAGPRLRLCGVLRGYGGLLPALPAVSLFPEDGALTYKMLKRDFPGQCSGFDM